MRSILGRAGRIQLEKTSDAPVEYIAIERKGKPCD